MSRVLTPAVVQVEIQELTRVDRSSAQLVVSFVSMAFTNELL